jgi:hypothetical protein
MVPRHPNLAEAGGLAREDALESIIEVGNRLVRANVDWVRLWRRLGLLDASFTRNLHQVALPPESCRLVTAMNFCRLIVRLID